VIQQRLHDAPRLFDAVYPGEQLAIDVDGLEQPDLVVVAQHLHA
jgi:hypothetical protein